MNAMSDEFGLTAELRPQMIPSGRAKLWDNRV
jgi:restriction endonuclease Mrr